MGPGGLAVLLAVLSAVPGALRPAAAAASEERPASPAVATPCWRVEQFVVAQECTRCSGFEMKTIPACGPTGFIERINCASSHRDEYKRGSGQSFPGDQCQSFPGDQCRSFPGYRGREFPGAAPTGRAPQLPLGRAGGSALLAFRGLGAGRGGGGGGAGGAAAARPGPAGAGEGPQTDRVHLARGSRGLGAGNSAGPERREEEEEEEETLPCWNPCWDLCLGRASRDPPERDVE